MRTLIYSNTGLTSWQLGLNTEVIENLSRDENRDILLVNCDGVLTNCYFNKAKNPIGCAICQSRQNHMLLEPGLPKTSISKLKLLFKEPIDEKFNSLEQLVAYTYKGFAIGRGVASSIISYFRDYIINSEKYGELINIEIQKSINVLINFEKYIEDFDPQEIYVFNGRFSEIWPVVMLAQKHNITYYSIESGSPNKYQLFKNSLPHSIIERERILKEIWTDSEITEKTEIGKSWYEGRRYRSNTLEPQFTKDQTIDLLPKNFDTSKTNIAIFNSSEDEVKVIEEWANDIYDTQNEAISKIVSSFYDAPEYHFYLRVHPNLGKVKNLQMEEIYKFDHKNLTIIYPDEKIDSYALLEAVDKVITFGSSMGIEATYWGVPSILFGKSFYWNLDATYNPSSFEELSDMVKSKTMIAKPKENTYSYGYFMLSFGQTLKHYKFEGLNSSYYKDKKVPVFMGSTVTYLFRYLKHTLSWWRLLKIFKPSNPFRFK